MCVRVCVFLPVDTSLISLVTIAISFLAKQRTASVFSRWPNMTWLSRLLSSSKCESIVTSVELAGRGTQEEVSLAQLQGKRSTWSIKACSDVHDLEVQKYYMHVA